MVTTAVKQEKLRQVTQKRAFTDMILGQFDHVANQVQTV